MSVASYSGSSPTTISKAIEGSKLAVQASLIKLPKCPRIYRTFSPKPSPTFNPSSLTSFLTKRRPAPRSRPHNHHQILSMFTGIVEEMGTVKQLGQAEKSGFHLTIQAKTILEDVNLGDSIAINGTCLTVTTFNRELSEFTVGLAPETLRKTSLIELSPGSKVNLERAVKPSTRMGGHFVQGHVDETGVIVAMDAEGDSLWVKVRVSPKILKFIVPKGFITVDGTSLTVVEVFDEEQCFNFMLVAYTQEKVVIAQKKVGEKVNLEVDILGKYVERLLGIASANNVMPS